ncbi:hypothetical protein [uncultured Phenylobacterium sp.]|nr:hypothetical protein [uncultured Phenylobacterium sp.]
MTLPTDPEAAREAERVRRSKLIGRIVIIGFGLLLLGYFVPLAWTQLNPA